MAQVIYARRALADLERVTDFLLETEPATAQFTVELIAEAIQILKQHPFIGRPVERELRELVISRGTTGYLALYAYVQEHDAVLILAIRHQREAGYPSI